MMKTAKYKLKIVSDLFRSIMMGNITLLMFYGLMNTLFSVSGYYPIEAIQKLLPYFGQYIIPFSIAYTSGTLLHHKKGGSIATIICSVIILQQDYMNILGVMLIACIAVKLYELIEKQILQRVTGYEMLTTNLLVLLYSLIGLIVANVIVLPFMDLFMSVVLRAVMWLSQSGWIAIANLFIEPAKIFNLNNAVNNIVLTPLALEQVNQTGHSILFFLEANPGPGLGLMLAFLVLSKGTFRQSVKQSGIIHAIGGIHELYFPYALMSMWLFIPLILGGISGTLMLSQLSAGLTGPISPGSLIPLLLLSPKDQVGSVFIAFAISMLVSFSGSIAVLLITKQSFSDYAIKVKQNIVDSYHNEQADETKLQHLPSGYRKIVFACDAGMGSSAIGASLLAKKLKEKNIEIPVEHSSILNLEETTATLIITQENLKQRVQEKHPSAKIVTLMNYLDQSFYAQIVEELEKTNDTGEDYVFYNT